MGAGIDHGGRLAAAREAHPHAPRPWLDLSTGVNPHGWRRGRALTVTLSRLPDPADISALEAVAAAAFGAPADRVVAISGAEIAIRLLPQLVNVRCVAVATPTYGSHADAWSKAGVEVVETSRDALFDVDADLRVVVNPNNPDGAVCAGRDLVERSGGEWLVIDESFGELTPDVSAVPYMDERTIIMRSFGKFYGLPGVRLGFMVAPPDIVRRLRDLIGDWAVGTDAIRMGRAAYADAKWAQRMRQRLSVDAARLDDLLVQSGFEVEGGLSLFRLARCDYAAARAWRLGEQGVLVRTFSFDSGLIRFGLPSRTGWRRLKHALERSR